VDYSAEPRSRPCFHKPLIQNKLNTASYVSQQGGDNMSEKEKKKEEKGKAEEAAEKTGEVVGKGLKKGFGVVKAFGKGAKEAVTEKDEKKKK
jgi:uncharacterized protein with gpF-like domain